MNKTIAIFIGLLIVLVLVGFNTTYSVNFHEVAIKTRFGKPVEVIRPDDVEFDVELEEIRPMQQGDVFKGHGSVVKTLRRMADGKLTLGTMKTLSPPSSWKKWHHTRNDWQP